LAFNTQTPGKYPEDNLSSVIITEWYNVMVNDEELIGTIEYQTIDEMLFESRVLRRVFGPKRDEVTREWGKMHNEKLNDLYSLPNIVRVVKSRRMRWAGHVVCMGEDRGVHRVLVRKPEGKRPLRRPRHRWEDNIKMDLQDVGGGHGTGWSWLRIGTGGGHLWVR
jgi:hypothetical protein